MLTKTKKIALLTTGLVGTLLATTIGGVVLSSCTSTTTVDDPKNEFGNKFTSSIDWNNQEEVSRLNIDKNGLVYSDQNRTILIGILPGTSISELVIPKSVKQISGYMDKTDNAAGVAKGAFEGQATLTSVKFEGSSVEDIGNQAFKGCVSLTTIQLPKSVTKIGNNAFEDTGSIAKINLDNVKFIGNSAFKSAFVNLPSSTTEINLSNVQYIDTMAFMGNPSIKSINLNNNKVIRNIQSKAFEGSNLEGTIDLSNATLLKTIGNAAFKDTTGLESIVLPSSLTNLGATSILDVGVFQNSSVKSIDISKTQISTLYRSSFNGATNLTEVKFPASLVEINLSAFSGTGFKSLDLSNTNITNINSSAFQDISNLVDIKFPTSLTTLGNNALKGTNLASVDLSNTKITTIGESNFDGNTSLTNIKLPATLTTIGNNAFKGTTGLESIDFSGTQINNIGNNAFENSGITSIVLPKLADINIITSIGIEAFKGSKIQHADFRFTNLESLPNGLFWNCKNLEYILVKSPDLKTSNLAADSTPLGKIQRQIKTIGNDTFNNAINLQGIFHVTDDNSNEQWTPNGIIVASPFLTSIGSRAFYNVNKIEIFDASLVRNPNERQNLINTSLFAQDDILLDDSGNRLIPQLKAVILPNKLDEEISTNFDVSTNAFKNNINLGYIGTKKTLDYVDSSSSLLNNKIKASDYLSKFNKSGFQSPRNLNVMWSSAFENTGIETIDFSETRRIGPNSSDFGDNSIGNTSYGYKLFANNSKLKKVILPTWLSVMQNSMFENTPLLEEVNFNELTNLKNIGSNNFTNLQNFKSSSITNNPTSKISKRSVKDSEVILDLSKTKLVSFSNNDFINLPSGISKIILPTTINSTFATNRSVLTVTETNNNISTTSKINLKKVEFNNLNGENVTKTFYQGLMTNSNSTETATPALFIDKDTDLTSFLSLTTLSPNTFSQNRNLTTLKLPASATIWKIARTSGQGDTLNSDYSTAVFSSANKLNEISFNGFKKNASDNFEGNIEDLVDNQWDDSIKTNNSLWSTITTMMNSLGYDASLDSVASPALRVQDKWVAPTTQTPTGTRSWIEQDLQQTDLIGANVGENKWWTDKSKVGSTSELADAEIKKDLVAANNNKSIYFKHNGIIWTWTQAKDSNNKITITLTPDESTLPNVYKATANATDSYITTFRTAKYAAPTSTKAVTPSFGVNIKFNIAITTTKK